MKIKICLHFLFVLNAFLFSCEREFQQQLFNTLDDPAIATAKVWYEGWLQDNRTLSEMYPSVKADDDNKQGPFWVKGEPLWGFARTGADGVVEVPLSVSQGMSLSADKDPTEDQLNSSVTRLLILRDEDGHYYQAYMHIQADASYLSSRNYNLQSNHYKEVDPHFTGRVFYTSPEGYFVNGWGYIDGKLVTAIAKMEPTDRTTDEMPKTKGNECWIEYTGLYQRTCWYDMDTGIILFCSPWEPIGLVEIMNCVTGEGGGGTPPPPATCDINITKNGSGSVTVNGQAVSGTITLVYNTQVTIVATANYGHRFTNWSGTITGTDYTVTRSLTGNINATAHFSSSLGDGNATVETAFTTALSATSLQSIVMQLAQIGKFSIELHSDAVFAMGRRTNDDFVFLYNPVHFGNYPASGLMMGCLHELYHMYIWDLGLSNIDDHSNMLASSEYMNWIASLYPDLTTEEHAMLKYAGATGGPEWLALSPSERQEIRDFFDDKTILY